MQKRPVQAAGEMMKVFTGGGSWELRKEKQLRQDSNKSAREVALTLTPTRLQGLSGAVNRVNIVGTPPPQKKQVIFLVVSLSKLRRRVPTPKTTVASSGFAKQSTGPALS